MSSSSVFEVSCIGDTWNWPRKSLSLMMQSVCVFVFSRDIGFLLALAFCFLEHKSAQDHSSSLETGMETDHSQGAYQLSEGLIFLYN